MDSIKTKRITAFIIDVVVISFGTSLINSILPITFLLTDVSLFGVDARLGITLGIFIYFIYFTIFDIISNGNTIGKQLVKITTISNTLKKLRLKDLILRSFYKTLSIIILPISVIIFLFTKEYTIQDKLVKTTTILMQ